MPTLSKKAAEDLEDLPEALQKKARTLIDRLDEEPSLGKKLLGKLAGKRSARLGRTHRIIYRVSDAGAVFVITIIARKDAYR